MPEQRGDLGQAQLAIGCTLDQREERAEFFLRRDQRGEAGAQHMSLARDADCRFPAQGVGGRIGFVTPDLFRGHAGTTGPELSSWIV